MAVYYNEFDPFAADWLRELIAEGLIAPGDVDGRSILEVRPADLAGYSQCHFFAGIGIWSFALRRAGWADDRPVWTGSCPCQPLSGAGQRKGHADERHLWPAFHALIAECRPAVVFGEQVAGKDGREWLAAVRADLEASRYACGAADLCAAGVGAPHIRQRLFWVADADRTGQRLKWGAGLQRPAIHDSDGRGAICGLADADDAGLEGRRGVPGGASECAAWPIGVAGRMADAGGNGDRQHAGELSSDEGALGALGDHASEHRGAVGGMGDTDGAKEYQVRAVSPRAGAIAGGNRIWPGAHDGLWRDADWLLCRDGKWRPVRPGTFPLADAGAYRNRVGLLRGAGNAINVSVAQVFIESVMDLAA